ncbi:MAG: hypothetical protein ACJA01_003775 [Saprospiraceae bacterium]
MENNKQSLQRFDLDIFLVVKKICKSYAMIINYTKAAIPLGLFFIIASCAEDGFLEETPRVITPEPQEIVDATL